MNAKTIPSFVVVEEDPFKECLTLDHEVIFFIPSTVDVNGTDDALVQSVLEKLSLELASTYGGVTENAPARGGWVSDTVGLVREQVIPLTVYISELSLEVKQHIVALAKYVRDTLRQESVLFVVDGQGRLI